jgi:hypothetical protein
MPVTADATVTDPVHTPAAKFPLTGGLTGTAVSATDSRMFGTYRLLAGAGLVVPDQFRGSP